MDPLDSRAVNGMQLEIGVYRYLGFFGSAGTRPNQKSRDRGDQNRGGI